MDSSKRPRTAAKSSANSKAWEAVLDDNPLLKAVYSFLFQEGKAVKNGWVAIVIIVGLGCWLTRESVTKQFDKEIGQLGETQKREKEAQWNRIHDLERQSDDLKRERDKLDSELQPWKDRAIKEFPFDDVTGALAKLEAKTDTILDMFKSSVVSPLNEPISSATCTIIIQTNDKNNGDGSFQLGTGAYAAYCSGGVPLLVATTPNHIARPNGVYEFSAVAGVFDALMDKPVNLLAGAQFIQIGFPKGLFKDDTEVLDGTVVWVINGRMSLRYKILAQKMRKAEGAENDKIGSVIVVSDLGSGASQLTPINQRSGTRQNSTPQ